MFSRLNGYRVLLLGLILLAVPVVGGPASHKTSGDTVEGFSTNPSVSPDRTLAVLASESLGRLNEYIPSDTGFGLFLIQKHNSVYGEFQEVLDVLMSRFEVVLSIDIGGHAEHFSHKIRVEGYCGQDQKDLEFYWSDMLTGAYTYLSSISTNSDNQKYQSISITVNTGYIRMACSAQRR